jgi:ribonuclease D
MGRAEEESQRWMWVDNQRRLEIARKGILESSIIGIDTEYDSFRYFRDKLCLVQIKTRKRVYILDPLGGLDLSFLNEAFSCKSLLKIFHAGDNDIRLLRRDYAFEFQNVFDTQRAAGLLGRAHLALASLIQDFLGIQIEKNKKIQRSRWDIRPLTHEQLTYAVADAAHLIDLFRKMEKNLKAKGLEQSAHRSFQSVAGSVWQERVLDHRGHEKIRGYSLLSARQQRRVRDLYRWRFYKAKEMNRAVFMVLSDQRLIELSCLSMPSLEVLFGKGILLPDWSKLYGQEILQVLRGRTDEQSAMVLLDTGSERNQTS